MQLPLNKVFEQIRKDYSDNTADMSFENFSAAVDSLKARNKFEAYSICDLVINNEAALARLPIITDLDYANAVAGHALLQELKSCLT